jgi:fumarate reductase flavoprotein subunit
MENESKKGFTRRSFIKTTAISSIGIASAGLLAGCGVKKATQETKTTTSGNEQPSFMTAPAPIPNNKIKNTVNADVVVVGCGLAGMCAAISAAESGAKVTLLEKLDRPQTRGLELGAVGSKLQKSIGNNMDPEEITNELMRWSGWRGDQRVIKQWVDHSGEVSDWMVNLAASMGFKAMPPSIEGQIEKGAPFKTYPTNSIIFIPDNRVQMSKEEVPSQATLRHILKTRMSELKVGIYYNTPGAQLIREGESKVTGIIGGEKDNYTKFLAKKGVILCTGDYGNDKEMLKYYIPSSKDLYNVAYTGIQNTGDGHKMGLWIGAAMDGGSHCPMYFDQGLIGTNWPVSVALTRQPWLGVNDLGERFANEDLPYGWICNSLNAQGGHKWVVWDSQWPELTKKMHMIICKEMVPPFHIPPKVEEFIAKDIIIKRNSMNELIAKMGVPANTFKATLARYNELAKKGKDEDFYKRKDALYPIEQGPFYACKLGVTLLVTMGGLKINDKMEVLDQKGQPIKGLYAAGNASGNFFANDYPITVSGVSHGRAFTFGYLAGKNAAMG